MSLYPNSDMNEPLDGKPSEPADDKQNSPGGGNGASADGLASRSQDPAGQSSDDDELIEVPEHIAKLREGQFYDPAMTFKQEIAIENPEMPPEQVEAVNVELRRMAGDVGLSSGQVKEVAGLMKAYAAEPPSDEQQAAWREEATSALSRQYGSWAHEALELARQLVQRDERIAALIDAHGLGNHPRVIATLVERAYGEQAAGRL